MKINALIFFFGLLAAFSAPLAAQEVRETLVRAELPGRSIAALMTRTARGDSIKRVVFLLPGHPGIMKLETPDRFELRGNFLIRTRAAWVDDETVVVSVDAPSDEWCCFNGSFRASARYAEDLRALRRQIEAETGAVPFIFVGTSEGSLSAYYAALALQRDGDRVIFTASLFNASRTMQGLAGQDFSAVKIPMLFAHHEDDPCTYTPYAAARRVAEKTGAPLITVRHPNRGSGGACQARTQHGFIGVEQETIAALKTWVVTGQAADVNKP